MSKSHLNKIRNVCVSCRFAGRVGHSTQYRSIHESTLAKRREAARLWQLKADAQDAGEQATMLDVLEKRGYVNQIAGDREKMQSIMRDERIGVYVGVDPTAPSLHIGHLIPLMALFWMYANGYHTYTLLGGATAAVGDPSGRKKSRELSGLSRKHNLASMHLQLKAIWANVDHHLRMRRGVQFDVGSKRGLLNNSYWLNKLPVTQFLRMLGKHTRVGTMLGRETARYKMEHGDGLSFAEFTYPLLQGWDWWQLYKTLNVKMQIGGSDQMGNIIAGKEAFAAIAEEDLIESGLEDTKGATPIGFTVPLLTTTSGAKFGKSEGNAIWLDPQMTSVFEQYQFFLRTADADLERYLKLFTFLGFEEITSIMTENAIDPGKRVAAKKLAEEFCLTIHGSKLTNKVKSEHAALFGGEAPSSDWKDPNHVEWEKKGTTGRPLRINPQVNSYAPQTRFDSGFQSQIVLPEHRIRSSSFAALLTWTSMVGSRSEGNRLIKSGGAYVGHRTNGPIDGSLSYIKIPSGLEKTKTRDYVMDGNLMILRIGKWKTRIVQVVTDEVWETAIRKAEEAEMNKEFWTESERTGNLLTSSLDSSTTAASNEQEKSSAEIIATKWLSLERQMRADDVRWERDIGEMRNRKSEEKMQKKALRQELMLDEHSYALNPQRKGGRRVVNPINGTEATLVQDWDKRVDRL